MPCGFIIHVQILLPCKEKCSDKKYFINHINKNVDRQVSYSRKPWTCRWSAVKLIRYTFLRHLGMSGTSYHCLLFWYFTKIYFRVIYFIIYISRQTSTARHRTLPRFANAPVLRHSHP